MTISTPNISSSGNIWPQSITTMSRPLVDHHIEADSPQPPSGMILTAPGSGVPEQGLGFLRPPSMRRSADPKRTAVVEP